MKKKALILLLIIPFFISILAFVTSSFVIRGVEVDIISISFDEYSANQAFLLSEEEVKLKVNVNKDPNYPLSEGNDLVFSSSNDDIASIDIRDDGAYLILHEEGETLITCSNEKGNKSASFNAIVVGSNGAIILNTEIPFSSSRIDSKNYVGLYDSIYAYDQRKSDASLKLSVETIGSNASLDSLNIHTSDNVIFNRQNLTLSFLFEGNAFINMSLPYSSKEYSLNFSIVEGVNIYDYDDLIDATNKDDKKYNCVLRCNLESKENTYNLDSDGKVISYKNNNTKLFGRLDDNDEVYFLDSDIYRFETTYNHDFLDKWNNEIDQGMHEGESKTSTQILAGVHIKGDFYGNGFTINTHELTYPSGRQEISVDGETYVIPYLKPDDIFRGPLPFVSLGSPNYSYSTEIPIYTLFGQDNVSFYVDNDNSIINDVHFKACDFGNNLSNLEYVGTVLDIYADNVTIKNSIIENGRNIIRSYSSQNLLIDNCLLSNAMEFLFRSGSNEYNHVNYDEDALYHGKDGVLYQVSKLSYLSKMDPNNVSENDLNSYKADSMLTFSAIYNTQANEFFKMPSGDYTKEEYIIFKDDIINALTNTTGFYDENSNKVYAGSTTINDTYFYNSGIASISLDSLPQGSFLENNTTSLFNLLLSGYMDGAAPNNMALTGYPTLVNVEGNTKFYDWKTSSNLTFQSLISQDIENLILSHGGVSGDDWGVDVSITEDDYLPIKKLLLDNYSSLILKDDTYLNIPVYIQGGGYNISDIYFEDKYDDILTSKLSVDPFTYSLDLKAYFSDHFMTDPRAKYETMKVAMLRASSNVLGFNNYNIIALNKDSNSWFNEYPNISDLINNNNNNN